jgi:deoxyribodipyrimidine photo-lyase
VETNKIGAVICDFSPLRVGRSWIDELNVKLGNKIPIIQVDGHNIIPCWYTSDQMELAAFKIRAKIVPKLDEFLTEFPPLIEHPILSALKCEPVNWEECYNSLKVNMDVKPVQWAKPGYEAAVGMLESFVKQRLPFYQKDRNDPNVNAQSNLSPWFHFGHISAQRAVLEVNTQKGEYPQDVEKFVDECVIWRELSENFCYYQPNYDNIDGCEDWALKTLKKHLGDKRQYVYTMEQFEFAKTHDPLWNAAQIQMVKEGKMHGFFRMYWGKKILEWTATTEDALAIAIHLNDKYSIDGRDVSFSFRALFWL